MLAPRTRPLVYHQLLRLGLKLQQCCLVHDLTSYLHLETEGVDVPAESFLYFFRSGVLGVDLSEEAVGQRLVCRFSSPERSGLSVLRDIRDIQLCLLHRVKNCGGGLRLVSDGGAVHVKVDLRVMHCYCR